MRSIWSGSVVFGLVNVPVKVYSATEDHDVRMHQVHAEDGGRIRYQRRCEVCGEIVEYADIAKAYDDGDRTVVLTDDDLAALPAEKSKEIEVTQFVPNDQIDVLLFDKPYYLEPDSKAAKAYALLAKTLEQTALTAVVQFSMRQRTRLGVLRVRDDVLVLQTLLWSDELREPGFDTGSAKVTAKELDMSATLVKSYAGDFEPTDYVDEYQVELRKLIEAKLEQGDSLDTAATFGETEEPAAKTGGDVVDLMEALRKSIERKRSAGTAPVAESTDEEQATSVKKPRAKKAATTKTSAKTAKATAKAPAKAPTKKAKSA